MRLRLGALVLTIVLCCAQGGLAQTTSSAFPKSRIDPCQNIGITVPQGNGAEPALHYMAAQAYEACGHTWPPGANACRNFLAAGDEYKIAASLTAKPSDHIAQFGDWLEAKRAYGWANAYCPNASDKDRAMDGFTDAMQHTANL